MSVALLPSKVAAALESTGMPFRVVECDPDYADTFPYCEKYGVAPEDAANTIVARLTSTRGWDRTNERCPVAIQSGGRPGIHGHAISRSGMRSRLRRHFPLLRKVRGRSRRCG